MELSPEVANGLKRLANTSLVSEDNFNKLHFELSSYLDNPLITRHSVGIPNNTPRIDVLKESYAAITIFLIECIRRNLEPEILRSLLLEHRIQSNRIEKILKIFSNHKSGLQSALKRFNSQPPEVYDVTWRMNYCVKSSFSDFDGKCLYFIDLKLAGNCEGDNKSQERRITFACTVQQLQSLVASLRAAVRRLESIASVPK